MSDESKGREVAVADGGSMMAAIADAKARGIPISTLLMAHPVLQESAGRMAQSMAKAAGVVPGHLIGKPEACFAVLCKALHWGLDAYEVAQTTYQTPGGAIGYFGTLVHAVLASHPRVERMHFEDLGDWSVLAGKFAKKPGKKTDANGNPIFYMAETWTPADEAGLGVRVWAEFKDGTEGEKLEVWLSECNPRNATTWPTRPRLQIRNVAIRAYARQVDPQLFMGTRFDDDDPEFGQHYGPERAKDVTPEVEEKPQPKGSKLDRFAERHGKAAPAEAKPAQSPQEPAEEHADPETGECTGEPADARPDEDGGGDGAVSTDGGDDLADVEVMCVLASGKSDRLRTIPDAERWLEQCAGHEKMNETQWQGLLKHNDPWISGLPEIRRNILLALFPGAE